MNPIPSSLFHRVLLPAQSNTPLHPAIVYLHGRGADEEDLLGLSGYLDERFLSISVRAPFRFDPGYTWYDILEMGKPEPDAFKESYDKLSQFMQDALVHYPIDPHRLFLFGFSMGSVMAYALLLTRPELYAGIVANSGYLAEGTFLQYAWNKVEGKDVFIGHGKFDPLIPPVASEHAYDLFMKAKAKVVHKEYAMAHQISDESLGDVASWLEHRLDSQS